jgi:hypothetical protein
LLKLLIYIVTDKLKSVENENIFADEEKPPEQVIGEDGKKKKKAKEPSADLKRVFLLNKPEWGFIIIGCISSIVSGAVQPAFSIIFSKVISVFGECDPDKQREKVILYCLLFVAFGVVTLLSNFFQV